MTSKKQEAPQEPVQETPASPAAAITFVSPHANLIVYGGGVKIATFEGGRFSSANVATITALRAGLADALYAELQT